MKPVISPSPVPGDNYGSTDYATLEARAVGQRHGSGSELAAQAAGIDGVAWVSATGVANGTLALVDANHDWRDRAVTGFAYDLAAAANRPGGATDHNNWPPPTVFGGYTRTGGLSNVATGAGVTNGNPPVWATGAGGTSSAVTVASNILLYADPSTGALYLYNATVNPQHLWLQLSATADLGLR